MNKNLRNMRLKPETDLQLSNLRANKWANYVSSEPQNIEINGKEFLFRSGLTFTPFANPVACNAHCRFCSEDLQRNHDHLPTAQKLITDYDQYFLGLKKAFLSVKNLYMGLSLSGLEATAEPIWLIRLLDLINENICKFDEKVLYTNGTGLFKYPHLINALQNTNFDRIELSRCHHEQAVNQKIMYFNRNEPVWENLHYETLVRNLQGKIFVKNSCILTKEGIKTISDIESYLDWANNLGIKEVVFRELSQLDNSYMPNTTAKWVEKNRVSIESILQELSPLKSNIRTNWEYIDSTVGYYYYNEHYLYRNQIKVIMETSSYPALMTANASGIVQKLIFHKNGNLCGDWDSDSYVIGNFY